MADAGTHLTVANGQRGLEEYLSFLQASGAACPEWWPPDFTYLPPRTMRFFLVDPDSALGCLADTLVRPEAARRNWQSSSTAWLRSSTQPHTCAPNEPRTSDFTWVAPAHFACGKAGKHGKIATKKRHSAQ